MRHTHPSLFTFIVLFLMVLTSSRCFAQYGFEKHFIGIQGGGTVSNIRLNYSGYSRYFHTPHFDYSFGLRTYHRLVGDLGIRADAIYSGRGGHLEWCDLTYNLSMRYFDIRIPLQYNFNITWHDYSPFLSVGPSFNIAHLGNIAYSSNATGDLSIPVDKGSSKSFDFGIWASAGIDFYFKLFHHTCAFTIEAGYYHGLSNTFANPETEGGSHVENSDMEGMLNQGSRKHHGVELSLAFSFALERDKKTLNERQIARIVARDTKGTEVSEENDTLDLPDKDCYTIDEIIEFVNMGGDIVGKKICLFDINFAFDSYDVNWGASNNLKKFARLMAQYPEMTICISGHTDSLGSDEYNDRLSLNRAKAIGSELAFHGVEIERMTYKGFGEKQPIESNSTEWGRHRNRRVEIEILSFGKKLSNPQDDEEVNSDQ